MEFLSPPNYYIHADIQADFTSLVADARAGDDAHAMRIIIDGDSQETSPTGQGVYYIPSLSYEFWRRFGNIPESQIVGLSSLGGVPSAGMGIRTASAGGDASGDTSTTRYPYSLEPSVSNRYNNDPDTYGFCFTLQANLLSIDSILTHIPRNIEYISRTGLTFKMLFPFILTQGDTAHLRCSFSTTGTSDFFQSNTATFSEDISDAQANDEDWLPVSITYDFGASPPTPANLATLYPQVIVRSANATPVEVGLGFFASANKVGVSFIPTSAGGVATDEHFVDRNRMGPLILAIDPSAIILHCGANDAGDGDSVATYKAAVIDKIRAYQGLKPTLLFILICDPPRGGLTAPQLTEFNSYPTALHEIAQDPTNRALFINAQRLVYERYDWTSSTVLTGGFTHDSVHYTVRGGRFLASVVADSFFRACEGLPPSPTLPTLIRPSRTR